MSAETTTGVLLPCPRCGTPDSRVKLHLDDGAFECDDCGEIFYRHQLEAMFARWRAVLAWVDQMPKGGAS